MNAPLLEARGLEKSFRAASDWLKRQSRKIAAVGGVDLDVGPAETVALVGESGSGKSTLGRLVIRLLEPDAGSVRFDGNDLLALDARSLRKMRRHFQIVFQDPFGALNPRMRVGSLVGEPLEIHKIGASRAERSDRVAELLREVGLDPAAASRYPHEFSGGQRQRIGIARAISCGPRFLVCDEPVSALDPPIAAQIVNLLVELQERRGMAYLFIAHDLRVVRHVASRVAVMYAGRIVERGPAESVLREPLHPYTRALRDSVPAGKPGEPTAPALAGEPPSPAALPSGCPFHPRCPVAVAACSSIEPRLLPAEGGREVACHLVHPPA